MERTFLMAEFINTMNPVVLPSTQIHPRTRRWFDARRHEVFPEKVTENMGAVSVATERRGPRLKTMSEAGTTMSSFAAMYTISEEKLGSGTYGIVYRGWENASGEEVAIKEIRTKRGRMGSDAAKMEASVMSALQSCPSVVGLRAFFEDVDSIEKRNEKVSYIVMDLCGGGDMQAFLQANGPLNEVQGAAVASEIAAVLQECHSKHILHCDVKASNFVIDSLLSLRMLQTDPAQLQPGWLKAIDFGTCQFFGTGQASKMVGTPTHWAPEVFGKKYSTEADMWSFGTLIYQLLSGRLPFWSPEEEKAMRTTTDLLRAIMSRAPEYSGQPWDTCTKNGLDFLGRLLEKDCRGRMTEDEVLQHPWIMHRPMEPENSNNLVPVAPYFKYEY